MAHVIRLAYIWDTKRRILMRTSGADCGHECATDTACVRERAGHGRECMGHVVSSKFLLGGGTTTLLEKLGGEARRWFLLEDEHHDEVDSCHHGGNADNDASSQSMAQMERRDAED